MPLEEKFLWNSLDLQLYYDPSRVDRRRLWCTSQQSLRTPQNTIELASESDPKCVQEQVQLKVLESHSSPLVSRSAPQGCSTGVLGGVESWGNQQLSL